MTRFAYDELNNRTNEVVEGVVTNRFVFETDTGLMLQSVEAGLATNSFTYDANGLVLTSTDPLGAVTTNKYDGRGLLLSVGNADGIVLTNFYDPALSWLVGAVDAAGLASTNYYDSGTGNLTKSASGHYAGGGWNEVAATTHGYDANGNQVAHTNALGVVTRYGYDALNRVIAVTNAFGLAEQATNATVYDVSGRVARTVNALGIVTAFGYDDLGRRISVTNALGTSVQQVSRDKYDATGNVTNHTDHLQRETDYIYDALNRPWKTIFPAVAAGIARTGVTNVYDALDRPVAVTNQAGLRTGYRYDPLGRLTSVTNALNKVTGYYFDAAGHQTNQVDALARSTKFGYDALGRRVRRELPLSAEETIGYDQASRLVAQTNFNGTVVTNQYDAAGRLWKRWSGGAAFETNLYSALGQLTNRTDPSGVHSWVFDALGRLKTNVTPVATLKYTYDRVGNLLTLESTTPNGVSLSYQYDALNRLRVTTDNRLAGSKDTVYAYDPAGNLETVAYPNGMTNWHRYDALNRLTNLVWAKAGVLKAGFGYTLGAVGNRLTLAETNNGSIRNYTWVYDDAQRLISEQIATTAPTGTLSHGYDDVGNRLSQSGSLGALGSQSFNYDQRDQIDNDAAAATASTYFDANGNTTSYGGTSQYDHADRLTNYNGGAVIVGYASDGTRVKKTSGGTTIWYLVATVNPTGYPQVVEEFTGTAPTTLSRVYAYGLDLIDQRIVSSTTTNFYGYDGLGSTKFLGDTAGAVTDAYTYDAFGNLIASTGTTPNRYLFAGEQWDADLGLYYLRARYYRPDLGRFWTRDTFEGNANDPLSLHKYVYAGDDPVNRIDPSGNESLISVVSSAAIQFSLRTSQFVAAHPVYTALGGIVASVAFPQLEAIPPGHPSPLDEMGQVGRIIRQGIAKGLAKVTMNGNHPLPKFLGGDRIQELIRIPSNVHGAFHKLLHERLQAKGFTLGGLGGAGNSTADWARHFQANPGSQQKAFEAVLEAARAIDVSFADEIAETGTTMSQAVWKSIIEGKFTAYP